MMSQRLLTPGKVDPRQLRKGNGQLRLWVGVGLAFLLALSASVPWILGIDASTADLTARLLPPLSDGYLVGTDPLGRDLLARTVASLGWSLGVGMLATLVSTVVGTTIGLLAGSSPGVLRSVLTRIVDIGLAFPYLVLAIAIMAVVGRGFLALTLALGLLSWPLLARVVYAETLGLMRREFVTAARLAGVSRLRLIFSHLLPGVRNSVMVMFAFTLGDLIVAESGLSFLGIGAPLGAPSLGNLLADGRLHLVNLPYLVIVPSIVIVAVVTMANLIGDGLAARSRSRTLRVIQ